MIEYYLQRNTELASLLSLTLLTPMNLPNTLSLSRIFMAAFFTLFLSMDFSWAPLAALICFILAALTDWLDGYLARKLNLITDLGKLLDPLADKILVAAAFVCFTEKGLCPAWATVAILFREFAVTGLRLLLVEKQVVLPADQWGKWKTVLQMVYCIIVLLSISGLLGGASEQIMRYSDLLLYTTVGLTICSGTNYFIKAIPSLR